MTISTRRRIEERALCRSAVDWLAQYTEEVIDPKRPIVDPHHHLWDRGGQRYLIEEIDCRYRLRPQHHRDRLCRGAFDVSRRRTGGDAGRQRGRIRQRRRGDERQRRLWSAPRSAPASSATPICCSATASRRCWKRRSPRARAASAASGIRRRGTREAEVAGMYATRPKGLLLDATFRKGFACLAPLGLSFDAWLFHPQIGELHRSGPRLSGHTNRPRSLRRPGRPRPLCRQARGDFCGLESLDPGNREMPQCRGETRRPGDAAARL